MPRSINGPNNRLESIAVELPPDRRAAVEAVDKLREEGVEAIPDLAV